MHACGTPGERVGPLYRGAAEREHRAKKRKRPGHPGSAEDLADADADARQEQGRERRVAAEDLLVGVGVAAGFSMSFDAIRREVHEPRFGDTGPGVAGELGVTVVSEGGIRDLDDEQDVARGGMLGRVEVSAWCDE